MRDSIVFYKSFFESISELPEENALNIYNSIFRYAFYDEVPELVGIEKAIFALIQPQIDANNKRYQNGQRGGRPKKVKTTEEENENHRFNEVETIGYENEKPNEKDNDNDTENDNVNNIICTEPETDSAPPVIEIILNSKDFYKITQNDVDEWAECYPAVNVMQELRKMKSWCYDNPTKRKTMRGIRRFINNWLSKEQDRGGVKNNGTNATGTNTSDYAISFKVWD